MANKKTDMSKIRQMLRLYHQGESKLKISELTGVSRNTFKKYLKIYEQLGLTLQEIELLSDQQLDRLFGENLRCCSGLPVVASCNRPALHLDERCGCRCKPAKATA